MVSKSARSCKLLAHAIRLNLTRLIELYFSFITVKVTVFVDRNIIQIEALAQVISYETPILGKLSTISAIRWVLEVKYIDPFGNIRK